MRLLRLVLGHSLLLLFTYGLKRLSPEPALPSRNIWYNRCSGGTSDHCCITRHTPEFIEALGPDFPIEQYPVESYDVEPTKVRGEFGWKDSDRSMKVPCRDLRARDARPSDSPYDELDPDVIVQCRTNQMMEIETTALRQPYIKDNVQVTHTRKGQCVHTGGPKRPYTEFPQTKNRKGDINKRPRYTGTKPRIPVLDEAGPSEPAEKRRDIDLNRPILCADMRAEMYQMSQFYVDTMTAVQLMADIEVPTGTAEEDERRRRQRMFNLNLGPEWDFNNPKTP